MGYLDHDRLGMNGDPIAAQLGDTRPFLRDIFKETYAACTKVPELRGSTFRSGMHSYVKEGHMPKRLGECRILVSQKKTVHAAIDMCKRTEARVGVLNFASGTRPGGGVVEGSMAQEESICRCTNLYPCLKLFESSFYKTNISSNSNLYTDECIYTPDVIIFRRDDEEFSWIPKDKWKKIDVVSCAAPNLRFEPYIGEPLKLTFNEQVFVHADRARSILSIFAENRIRHLVLGAFGCGAFRNDPRAVSLGFHLALNDFGGYFDEVEFAIFSKRANRNFDAFKNEFLGG